MLDNRSPAGADERNSDRSSRGFVDRDGAPLNVATKTGADKLVELMSEPSVEEIAFFEDRERRGVRGWHRRYGKDRDSIDRCRKPRSPQRGTLQAV